jgi:hypothetical protein
MSAHARLSPLAVASAGLVLWGICPGPAAAAVDSKTSKPIRFNQDIRPILADNCFQCHGFDQKSRKADRRLDQREGAFAEKDGVRAIVPGDLTKSEMHRRIHSSDPDEVMPPPKDGKKLTPEQKALLDEWIRQGAPYELHWSYTPPVKAAVPAQQHPVDAFIAQRHATVGMQFAAEADKRTLIRRLFFDVTGLPPSMAEVAAFEKDVSPEAYTRLVDTLLASPHYGERMAIPWLDVVRFADTIGYHSDTPRNIWPYRDYVIRSFNSNKRFDVFTREQIAGDLLPDATTEQKVGSAFNRLLLSTEEGGAQPKDYEARMLTDRVRAVGTVWLAQTIGCAQCHDHKFDPISTRDFYTMGAFFADISEGIVAKREPGMPVPAPEEEKKLADWKARLAALRDSLNNAQELEKLLPAWEASLAGGAPQTSWNLLPAEKMVSDKKSKLSADPDGFAVVAPESAHVEDVISLTVKTPEGAPTQGFRLEAVASEGLRDSKQKFTTRSANFVIHKVTVLSQGRQIGVLDSSASEEQKEFPGKQVADHAGKQPQSGWSPPAKSDATPELYLELMEAVPANSVLTVQIRFSNAAGKILGKARLSATQAEGMARAPRLLYPENIRKIVEVSAEKRNAQHKAALTAHIRETHPALLGKRREIAREDAALTAFVEALPKCIVSVHTDNKRVVRILPRGDWQNESGEVVAPALPSFFVKPPEDGRKLTRMDLANWLVSKENPLTARVFVNRLWKQFFGMGLSKVLDDLGSQGDAPVHGELLDWLACEFMDSGWDVKHMVRLLLTSRAYRQTSIASKELAARDPLNREWARQGRWRLDAELVRDNALQSAGLLVKTIGGPSVKPYQPEGYWENLNFPRRNYEHDNGPHQFRRGLYTWWQRSFVHPSMIAFDAPTREECAAERARSNIPQQALVLLNDPTYVEAARNLAVRIVKEGGTTADQRIEWAFRNVLQRAPSTAEKQQLSKLAGTHLVQFQDAPQQADTLLKVGISEVPGGAPTPELAAWTSVARVLLNLHETITRS